MCPRSSAAARRCSRCGAKRDALASFEAALDVDPSLTDVRQRAEVLRFRGVQDVIEAARAAAKSGRVPEARAAYERAIAASPESAFLYRELGVLERRAGNMEQALSRLRRATELDPLDATAFVQLAELLESRQDFAGAEAAYRKAVELDPSPELEARLAAVAKNAREAQLPPEFKAALSAAQITRGDLAALIGVRLEPLVRAAPDPSGRDDRYARPLGRAVDHASGRGGHHARRSRTTRSSRMRPCAAATWRRRSAVSLTLVASSDPALRARLAQRPAIADMNRRHVQYTAAAAAVASGVMPLLDGDRFQVGRPVSGSEAVDAVDRVSALSAQTANAGL